MRYRGLAGAACAAVLLAACSGGDEDDTDVLGAVIEATPAPDVTLTATPTPTAAASPTATPEPTATPSPAATPEATASAAPLPTAAATRAPAAPSRDAATEPPPQTSAPAVERLEAGDGWSTNTLLPDEGGEAWTEVSGQPPVGPDGAPEARLYVQLAHEPVTGDSAGRLARCQAWIEAPPGAALEVAGDVTVELLSGGAPVRASTETVEGTVPAGDRVDLPAWQQPERVHALEGEALTCTVRYASSG